jgi:hypothetical protein
LDLTSQVLWNGWDDQFKVVSVIVRKSVDFKVVGGPREFFAVYSDDTGDYYTVPDILVELEELSAFNVV